MTRKATININKRIERAFSQRNWTKVISLAQKELRRQPNDIWLLSTLQGGYLEKGEDKKALQIAKKIYNISPSVLNTVNYATALAVDEQYREAISLYKKLLRRNVYNITSDLDAGGMNRAKGIKNNCRLMIGECYAALGKRSLAIKWLQECLNNHKLVFSREYKKSEIQQLLKELTKDHPE